MACERLMGMILVMLCVQMLLDGISNQTPLTQSNPAIAVTGFMIDQTRLRGRAAGVTPLKIFAMFSQLFVTGWQKLTNC